MAITATGPSDVEEAIARARALFLDDAHPFGCAETTFVVLKEAFGLPNPDDAAAAMALNGGVAYSGGPCGAITGAALAVGELAGSRIQDHAIAKRLARDTISRLIADFESTFGAIDCRLLLGRDIQRPDDHAAFIESGRWRTVCMRQIEFAVRSLAASTDALTAGPTPARTVTRSTLLGGGREQQDDRSQDGHRPAGDGEASDGRGLPD